MSDIPFSKELEFEYGVVAQVAPGLRRVIAKNPSPFTFHGTGTYIVGSGQVAVIDPGPEIPEHVQALIHALKDETITHILVTHTHIDHSPACRLLQPMCDAPTYGFGPHGEGKIEQGVVIEEGGDMLFEPDIRVVHGDIIEGDGWSFECVYTPGHTSNHVCYAWREQKSLFSGDHVMGWSTTVVSPPDGDMGDYMRSLELLLPRNDETYYPTHGNCIKNPQRYVRAYMTHRRQREQQIRLCIGEGVHQITDMVQRMYKGVDPRLHAAAARSVLATLVFLVERGEVRGEPEAAIDASYFLC